MTEQTEKRLAEGKKLGGRPEETLQKKMSRVNVTLQVLEVLYKLGWTDAQVASSLEIDEKRLEAWKKEEELRGALKEWKIEADVKVERALYERAMGYRTKYKKNIVVSDGKDAGSHVELVDEEVVYPPDTVACIFWLKNRQKDVWRDKHEFEGNMNVSAESLMRLLDEAKKKAANRLANVN